MTNSVPKIIAATAMAERASEDTDKAAEWRGRGHWSWPPVFERLVVQEGWTVVTSELEPMGFRHVVEYASLRFGYLQAKDCDPRSVVGLIAGTKDPFYRAEHPSDIASLAGHDVENPFEAFDFISKNIDVSIRKFKILKLRRLTIEPLLMFPFVVPLLILVVFLPNRVRNHIFELILWWQYGPVRRAVYWAPSMFTKGLI
jgi:hypothetical protein